jgi:hypothetical protein
MYGQNACALNGDGRAWCWGAQVPTVEGLAATDVPQQVPLLESADAIAV